jgi:hypothetical protein
MESENRLRPVDAFPKSVYLQSLCYFFGANFMFHHQVFRLSGNRTQFLAFMLVNAATSFQIADATVMASVHRYATQYNNSVELKHREALQYKLRVALFDQTRQAL